MYINMLLHNKLIVTICACVSVHTGFLSIMMEGEIKGEEGTWPAGFSTLIIESYFCSFTVNLYLNHNI